MDGAHRRTGGRGAGLFGLIRLPGGARPESFVKPPPIPHLRDYMLWYAATHNFQQETAMSIAPDSKTPTSAIPTELMRLPVGAVSPLWGLFAGAAMTGAAWWWMTRWARPENLEAMFGQAVRSSDAALKAAEAEAAALPEPIVEPLAVVEAATEVTEAVIEPAVEAAEAAPKVVEAIAEPIVEAIEAAPAPLEAFEAVAALVETPEAAPEPVGGESAPISPVVQAISAEISPPPMAAPKTPAKRNASKPRSFAADEG